MKIVNFIPALMEVAQSWLHPDDTRRQLAIETAAQEFCLSKPSFALALDWMFSQWTEKNIVSAIEQNPYRDCRYAAQIFAGNTPAMIAQGFLQGAILQIKQCIKLPSKQATFAKLVHQSLQEKAPEISRLFEVSTWQNDLNTLYSRFHQADVILAYGNDQTLATITQYLSPDARLAAHGHAESAAIIFKEGTARENLTRLAYDMLVYDQRGCLSPSVAFIEEGGRLSPKDCTRILAEEILPQIAEQLPRGGLFPGEAAEIMHQRCVYGFRGQVYPGSDWTLCFTEQAHWPSVSLPRFMPIISFKKPEDVAKILKPVQTYLISLGCAGEEDKIAGLKELFNVRYCSLGEMQKQLLMF